MNFNLELMFLSALLVTGSIVLFDYIFLISKRKQNVSQKKPFIIDCARSFFPILLLVFSIRSFAYEAYRIPSGSLKPTLLVGDLILVNKFKYGIRLPVIHTKLLPIKEPERGDLVVFREPPKESRYLIKRVIGLPGDQISYHDKILYINGEIISQQFEKYTIDQDENMSRWEVVQKQENLFGTKHGIYQILNKENDDFDLVVPTGNFFMMGDNRDNSADSREWGFLPEKNILGKATHVLTSFDSLKHPIRWERTGKKIV